MRTIKCDCCNCELTEQTAFGVVIGGPVKEQFDLCGNCREALIDFLSDRLDRNTPVETKRDEEDRMYEGPKNDKVGYSVYQLEKKFHRGRATIRAALAAMGNEAARWIRDNKLKVKYYLGEAELVELKKRLGAK